MTWEGATSLSVSLASTMPRPRKPPTSFADIWSRGQKPGASAPVVAAKAVGNSPPATTLPTNHVSSNEANVHAVYSVRPAAPPGLGLPLGSANATSVKAFKSVALWRRHCQQCRPETSLRSCSCRATTTTTTWCCQCQQGSLLRLGDEQGQAFPLTFPSQARARQPPAARTKWRPSSLHAAW